MKNKILLLFTLLVLLIAVKTNAQEEEKIVYYQMEPLDDSLFIHIQNEVFIDPPDPKAEIIVDLRDPNDQTISIKGSLYPFLALTPETRAKIITYPFKINLEESVNYGSVFTRVMGKLSLKKVFAPPSLTQISSTRYFVNPFLQIFGGERFGLPLKNDIGISLGLGTPYSGPLETNFMEANFHILGFKAGAFTRIDGFVTIKDVNNHNNLYVTGGYQFSYVLPFGNFFEVGFQGPFSTPSDADYKSFQKYDTLGYHAKIIDQEYLDWELRYPVSLLGSTRGKFYVAEYLGEWHVGYTGRELSLAGSTFDFRFDAMPKSDVRQPQYVVDLLVQKVFESWAFSAFAIGPSAVFSRQDDGNFGIISIFVNFRLKVGTSF